MLQFPDIVKYLTGIFMSKAFLNSLQSSLQDLFALLSSQCCKTKGYEFNFYRKYASTKKTVPHFILRCIALEFL